MPSKHILKLLFADRLFLRLFFFAGLLLFCGEHDTIFPRMRRRTLFKECGAPKKDEQRTEWMEQEYCRALPFWDALSEQGREQFCRQLVGHTYEKGSRVHGGESCRGVIFIKSGCLRVYMLSEEGRDVTLYRLYRGDVCMLSASCVLPQITFDVFVDAEERCECCVIEGTAFSRLAQEEMPLKLFAYETALARFSEVMWVVQQILFMKVDRRLAIFLLDEASRTGSDVIALSQEQIAKYMSSAREVVSRMLKYFANEKIVEVMRKGVRITDKRSLQRLAY